MMRPNNRRVTIPPEHRRLLARATSLWGFLTLSGVSILVGLTIWHLVRRGRLLRAAQPPPRVIEPLPVPAPDRP